MQVNPNDRRTYGTGAILTRNGTYYGKWRDPTGRQLMRKLGPIRRPGTRDGLTKRQAEARLRALISETVAAPPMSERITVSEAGARLIAHLTALDRKRATLESYESILRVHLAPFFSDVALSSIRQHDIERFIARSRGAGYAAKSTLNYLGVLHGIFDFSQRRGWITSNPCKLVDKPRAMAVDADIRFLDDHEIEALLRSVADDDVGRVEAVLYLTAVMTGMRQGELLALRWCDVDWNAQRIRVRRSWVRGEYGTPKSKRSTRSVPLATRLSVQLKRHYQVTAWQTDGDLVFAHPHTGKPMDRSRLLKRFKATLRRAGVRDLRFHDLRHTFGTRMAAAGVPMRTLQEFLGHRDFKTTLIYADYAPGANEVDLVNHAFAYSAGSGRASSNRDELADGAPNAEAGI